MNNNNDQNEWDDPRVVAALDEYVAALEAGHKPNRQAFLARHAPIADALADCLDGMEALHAKVENDSTAPPPVGPTPLGVEWQTGTPLGDYRILREIGRGGMGVVYEAEQLSLGRHIALKVLPFALTLDPRQLQRFKNEARAAAQLHHQHIVPVYAVGSERGVHFYAMQYIEGQSLAEVIQDLRRQNEPAKEIPLLQPKADRAATTGPYLPHLDGAVETDERPVGALATSYSANSSGFYRTAARLGIQAAEALEHAHEYGVIHRDIKPGNLMVDGHGQLWITDFGLAQFQTDAGLTQTGDLLGTLRYMSPEQAGGQRFALDHRTDIYSLGATLYELLTQHPPFEANDRQTLLQQILHEEPCPPRSHNKAIPIELETIVLKALAKAPNERYATARELADDLSRFLEHQPIRARRATAAQRLRKWARRHPSVVWAVLVLCLLTAAGSLVSAELIREEQKKTESAYRREKQRAQEAEEEFRLAREAVDGMFKLCEEELADKPFLNGLRQRLLQDYFLVYYQKLIEQRPGDAETQEQLSATRSRVSEILGNLAALQGVGQYRLLNDPAVLDDLQPQEEQRRKIVAWTQEMNRRVGRGLPNGYLRLPEEQRRLQLLENAKAAQREAQEILSSQQRERLRQIDRRLKGPLAFEEPDVIAALNLSAAQREHIHAIQFEAFSKSLPDNHYCFPDKPKPGGRPPEGAHERHPLKGENEMPPPFETVERIVKNVLNKQQQKQWSELTGPPFERRMPPPPHGRGEPRGRGPFAPYSPR